jgi:hypothetical protein
VVRLVRSFLCELSRNLGALCEGNFGHLACSRLPGV